MTNSQFEALFTEDLINQLQEEIKHGYLSDTEASSFSVIFDKGLIYLDLSFTISENTKPGSWALDNILESHDITVEGYSTFWYGTQEEAIIEGNIEDLSNDFIKKLELTYEV